MVDEIERKKRKRELSILTKRRTLLQDKTHVKWPTLMKRVPATTENKKAQAKGKEEGK
jgi:hypothetical protein